MSDLLVERSILLPCSIERAFELFTEEASSWWPPERRHTGDADSAIRLSAAGPFFERARDGRRVELGRVRAWEPPHRLLFDFFPGTDADHPTEVEVLFTAVPESAATRVVVLHRATPTSAHLFGERAPRYAASWDLLLPALARAAAAA